MSRDGISPNAPQSEWNSLAAPLVERDRQADEALSSRYDTLNLVFAQAEKRLKMLKPPHPVWVRYGQTNAFFHETGPDSPQAWQLLGLTKYQAKWRLCHALDWDVNDDGMRELRPVVECPAEVRVEAAKVVRKLHQEIVSAKENHIPQVDEAIRELAQYCAEV